jgi:hypothetical protein
MPLCRCAVVPFIIGVRRQASGDRREATGDRPAARCPTPDTRCLKPDARCLMPENTGYGVRDGVSGVRCLPCNPKDYQGESQGRLLVRQIQGLEFLIIDFETPYLAKIGVSKKRFDQVKVIP